MYFSIFLSSILFKFYQTPKQRKPIETLSNLIKKIVILEICKKILTNNEKKKKFYNPLFFCLKFYANLIKLIHISNLQFQERQLPLAISQNNKE